MSDVLKTKLVSRILTVAVGVVLATALMVVSFAVATTSQAQSETATLSIAPPLASAETSTAPVAPPAMPQMETISPMIVPPEGAVAMPPPPSAEAVPAPPLPPPPPPPPAQSADVIAPNLTANFATNDVAHPHHANNGDIITITLTANETLSVTPTANLLIGSSTRSISFVRITGTNEYRATYTTSTSDNGTLSLINIHASDNAGNTTTTATGSHSSITADNIAPILTASFQKLRIPVNAESGETTAQVTGASTSYADTGNEISISLNSNEPLSRTPTAELLIGSSSNKGAISFSTVTTNRSYSASYTIKYGDEGNLSLTNLVASDLAGNITNLASPTLNRIFADTVDHIQSIRFTNNNNDSVHPNDVVPGDRVTITIVTRERLQRNPTANIRIGDSTEHSRLVFSKVGSPTSVLPPGANGSSATHTYTSHYEIQVDDIGQVSLTNLMAIAPSGANTRYTQPKSEMVAHEVFTVPPLIDSIQKYIRAFYGSSTYYDITGYDVSRSVPTTIHEVEEPARYNVKRWQRTITSTVEEPSQYSVDRWQRTREVQEPSQYRVNRWQVTGRTQYVKEPSQYRVDRWQVTSSIQYVKEPSRYRINRWERVTTQYVQEPSQYRVLRWGYSSGPAIQSQSEVQGNAVGWHRMTISASNLRTTGSNPDIISSVVSYEPRRRYIAGETLLPRSLRSSRTTFDWVRQTISANDLRTRGSNPDRILYVVSYEPRRRYVSGETLLPRSMRSTDNIYGWARQTISSSNLRTVGSNPDRILYVVSYFPRRIHIPGTTTLPRSVHSSQDRFGRVEQTISASNLRTSGANPDEILYPVSYGPRRRYIPSETLLPNYRVFNNGPYDWVRQTISASGLRTYPSYSRPDRNIRPTRFSAPRPYTTGETVLPHSRFSNTWSPYRWVDQNIPANSLRTSYSGVNYKPDQIVSVDGYAERRAYTPGDRLLPNSVTFTRDENRQVTLLMIDVDQREVGDDILRTHYTRQAIQSFTTADAALVNTIGRGPETLSYPSNSLRFIPKWQMHLSTLRELMQHDLLQLKNYHYITNDAYGLSDDTQSALNPVTFFGGHSSLTKEQISIGPAPRATFTDHVSFDEFIRIITYANANIFAEMHQNGEDYIPSRRLDTVIDMAGCDPVSGEAAGQTTRRFYLQIEPIVPVEDEIEDNFPQRDCLTLSQIGHIALEVIGTLPKVGILADSINAVWYLAEGDTTNAAISAASILVPFVPSGVVKIVKPSLNAVPVSWVDNVTRLLSNPVQFSKSVTDPIKANLTGVKNALRSADSAPLDQALEVSDTSYLIGKTFKHYYHKLDSSVTDSLSLKFTAQSADSIIARKLEKFRQLNVNKEFPSPAQRTQALNTYLDGDEIKKIMRHLKDDRSVNITKLSENLDGYINEAAEVINNPNAERILRVDRRIAFLESPGNSYPQGRLVIVEVSSDGSNRTLKTYYEPLDFNFARNNERAKGIQLTLD